MHLYNYDQRKALKKKRFHIFNIHWARLKARGKHTLKYKRVSRITYIFNNSII